MKPSIHLSLLLLVLASTKAFTDITGAQHVDFGHVPMGATKTLTVELCTDDTSLRVSHAELPRRFTADPNAFPMVFDEENKCLDLNLTFHPEIQNLPFSHYGNNRWESPEDSDEDGIIIVSRGERHRIGSVSGTGISQSHWQKLYPPEAGNYFYVTSLVYPGKTHTEYHRPFVFSQLDHLLMLSATQTLHYIPTDVAPLWETHSPLHVAHGYCGVDLHPGNLWLAASNREKNRISIHDTLNDFKKNHHKQQRRGLYRICNAIFDKSGDILFSLGFKNASGMSVETQLSAWEFNQTSGELSGPLSEKQVGPYTDNSPLRPMHALATSINGFIVATHLHGSKPFDGRYYFDRDTSSFITINPFDDNKAIPSDNIDISLNGRFVVSTPLFGQQLTIKECYSAICHTNRKITTEDTGWESFFPTDARFAHNNQQLAVSAKNSNGLLLLRKKQGLPWEISQSLQQEDGFQDLDLPENLSFSERDRWLAVVARSSIQIFQKMESFRMRKMFHWPSGKREWWQNYLTELLASERAAKERKTEEEAQ